MKSEKFFDIFLTFPEIFSVKQEFDIITISEYTILPYNLYIKSFIEEEKNQKEKQRKTFSTQACGFCPQEKARQKNLPRRNV